MRRGRAARIPQPLPLTLQRTRRLAGQRVIVPRAGQRDDVPGPGVGVHDQLVESRWDHLVAASQEEYRRYPDPARVGDRIQIRRDSGGNRAGHQPQVPPSVLAQNDLPQRDRVLKYRPRNGSPGGEAQCDRRPEAAGVDKNRQPWRGLVHRIEDRLGVRHDLPQAHRPIGASGSGIVDSPHFDGALPPRSRDGRGPAVRPVALAGKQEYERPRPVRQRAGRSGDPAFHRSVAGVHHPALRRPGVNYLMVRAQDERVGAACDNEHERQAAAEADATAPPLHA